MKPNLKNGENYININGIKHWIKIEGIEHQTTPILFIHGGPGGNSYILEKTIGKKISKYFTVLYYDQRGCGRSLSPNDTSEYSMDVLIDDLKEICNYFPYNSYILFGTSFGAELALHFASKYPNKVVGVIAESPSMLGEKELTAKIQIEGWSTITKGEEQIMLEMIKNSNLSILEKNDLIPTVLSDDTLNQYTFHNLKNANCIQELWLEKPFLNTGVMLSALTKNPPISILDVLPNLKVNVLLLIGKYDHHLGVEQCIIMKELCMNASIHVFLNSGHFPHIEETDEFVQIVTNYIQLLKK